MVVQTAVVTELLGEPIRVTDAASTLVVLGLGPLKSNLASGDLPCSVVHQCSNM